MSSTHELDIENYFLEQWSTSGNSVTATDISASSSGFTTQGSVDFSSLSTDRWVYVTGFTLNGNNGIFKTDSLSPSVISTATSYRIPSTELAGNSVTVREILTPINILGKTFTVPDVKENAFVELLVSSGAAKVSELATATASAGRRFSYEGFVQLGIYTSLYEGLGLGRSLAQKFDSIFSAKKINNKTQFRVVNMGGPGIDTTNGWRLRVAHVEFRHEHNQS